MTSQSPRIYTYKITFEEVPYYYYGVHKERKFGEYYMGSPKTNKWCWEFYTPKKQILEIFDYTDVGYAECRRIEDRLIRPVLNDPLCLNETCGGTYSLDICRKAGQIGRERAKELQVGIYSLTPEQRVENGKKTKELGLGIFAMSKEEKVKIAKENEKNKIGIFGLTPEQRSNNAKMSGKISGKICFEKKLGIFGMDYTDKKEAERKGGSVTASKLNNQKWMCLETGYITTPGPLIKYQKARGIDTSKRRRIS